MQQYLDLLNYILKNGKARSDRTGVGTIGVFGYQMRFDLSDGFPLLTTKKVYIRGIIHELLWFLKGDTNIKYLVDSNVHIWDEWPFQNYLTSLGIEAEFPKYSEKWKSKLQEFVAQIKGDPAFAARYGDLGPVYGKQWRDFNGVDQIKSLIKGLKEDPSSRRHIISAWNPAQIPKMVLPPCHCLFQFYVQDGSLSCQLYQRSCDVFLGVPFNIASYSLFTIMVAHVLGLKPGAFVHTLGDAHIYRNHLDQVREQLLRSPRSLPKMKINPDAKDIFSFTADDFTLENYDPHPAIKAPIAI